MLNLTLQNNSIISTKDFSPDLKVKLLTQQSEFCKTFTNPTRLQIINVLIDEVFDEDGCVKKVLKELNVTEIISAIKKEFNIELNQTTVSQHISILKQHHVLESRRDGNNIYYKVANPKIVDACCVVREIVIHFLKTTASFSESLPENF